MDCQMIYIYRLNPLKFDATRINKPMIFARPFARETSIQKLFQQRRVISGAACSLG